MILRDATLDDCPAILKIMNDAILHSTALYDYTCRSNEYIVEWFTKKQEQGLPVLVAESQGVVAAYASYGIFRPFEGFRFSVEHSIYIDQNFQRQGIGKKLLKLLIEKARGQGMHTMLGGIDAENYGSITLHKQFGFQEVGRLNQVGFKFDRWLDMVFLQLIL